MRQILFACIIIIIFTTLSHSQIPDTIWTKTFGGSLADVGVSVKQTNDGGFIIAGTTSSYGAGGQDIYLIKTDENGDTIWTKTFGGTGSDGASNVQQTTDNGFAIFGTTNSYGNGNNDFLIWKTDSMGNTEWFKTYGASTDEIAYEGQQTFDSGYVIVGDSIGQNTKSWIIKTDEIGNFIWGRTIGTNYIGSNYWGRSVQQLDDGGYVLCGTHRKLNYVYLYGYSFTKISASGDSLFNKSYGEFTSAFCTIVRTVYDGNLILGGDVGASSSHVWLLKVNTSGSLIWEKTVSGGFENPIRLIHLEPILDKGIIISTSSITQSIHDVQLLKTDENGILIWEKMIGGPQDDLAIAVSHTIDSGYIVTGYTKSFGAGDSDIWLLKFKYNPPPEITVVSPNGGEYWLMQDTVEIKWQSTGVDSVKIQLSLNDGIDWLTITESTQSDSIYEWVVQAPHTSLECRMKISDVNDSTIFNVSDSTFIIDMFSNVDSTNSIIPTKFVLYQNYPNPFNPNTSISYSIPENAFVTLKIYDVLGNEVEVLINEQKEPGNYQIDFNASELSSGIYYYTLTAGNFTSTKKMSLIK